MESVNDIPENIRLALDFSRSFATAKPNIGRTEKEHIEGLANLLERVSAEREALQLMLNDREEQITSLEQRRHAEQQACQAAGRRVEKMEELLRQASMLILDAELLRAIEAALNPTAEAESHESH